MWLRVVALCALIASTGCKTLVTADRLSAPPSEALASAQHWEQHARHSGSRHAWLNCAGDAYLALGTDNADLTASLLAKRCTQAYLRWIHVLPGNDSVTAPPRFGGAPLVVELRGLSPNLIPPIAIRPVNASSSRHGGGEMTVGVPVVLSSRRCSDAPHCKLLPPEGIFRGASAWVERRDTDGGALRLVVAGDQMTSVRIGSTEYAVDHDTSAPYNSGARRSRLKRLAVWGLLGGREVGRRAGVYLLEDYDPSKRPVVMIHGLGSSPLIWEKLSNAIWASAELRARYQVWHVVYQTDAPLLVQRRRVQEYLNQAWSLLDPEHDDPAREHLVLVGHSLGGVIARMLCVDSGNTLWNAAFLVPPDALDASDTERNLIDSVFHFHRYPGVARAIFIASPHRGSPSATRWFGRLALALVGKRNSEITSLLETVKRNPDAIRPGLREAYRRGRVNSISTLQDTQPVSVAGRALMPASDIRFHTIAGVKASTPQGDGVVPLDSAWLSGADSTLVVQSGHNVHEQPQAIAEVLRILRLDERP